MECREQEFLPRWLELALKMPVWKEDGTFEVPKLGPKERVVLPVTHDEATYNANDGVHQR